MLTAGINPWNQGFFGISGIRVIFWICRVFFFLRTQGIWSESSNYYLLSKRWLFVILSLYFKISNFLIENLQTNFFWVTKIQISNENLILGNFFTSRHFCSAQSRDFQHFGLATLCSWLVYRKMYRRCISKGNSNFDAPNAIFLWWVEIWNTLWPAYSYAFFDAKIVSAGFVAFILHFVVQMRWSSNNSVRKCRKVVVVGRRTRMHKFLFVVLVGRDDADLVITTKVPAIIFLTVITHKCHHVPLREGNQFKRVLQSGKKKKCF